MRGQLRDLLADQPPAQLPDVLLAGFFPRDPRFSSDAGHASHTLEAHGAGGARDAIYAAGAIGALDALRAQLPATAGLSFGANRAAGTQFSFIPRKAVSTRDALVTLGAGSSSQAPVADDTAEALGAWQAGVSYAALPALEATDARGPRRALRAQSPR